MTVSTSTNEDYDNSGIRNPKYLVAPFEEELEAYFCQCSSCHSSDRYKHLLPWYCIGGFLLPLFWFANIVLYIQVQWVHDHKPKHHRLEAHELPTKFEADKDSQRRYFEVDSVTTDYMNRINEIPETSSETDLDNASYSPAPPRLGSMQHLKQIATEIIREHDSMRTLYKRWTAMAVLGVATYSTAIAFIAKALIR